MKASHLLTKWLAQKDMSPAQFADLVGAHRSQVYRLLSGERGPSIDLAAKIEQVTDGKVPALDWAATKGSRHAA